MGKKINIDPVPTFNYKNGDQVTASAVNANAIEVYNKINALNRNNVETLNTAHYVDLTNTLLYPNYCGFHISSIIRHDEFDTLIDALTNDINDIIADYNGD